MKTKNLATIIACIVATIVFILLIISITTNSTILQNIDRFFFYITHSISSEHLTIFAYYFSFLASPIGTIIIIAILVLLPSRKKIGIPTFICSFGALGAGYLLKHILARPRPLDFLIESNIINITTPSTYSFPSGHAMLSAIICLSIFYCLKKNNNISNICSILLILYCLTIGFCRIYLGVHYFSDILGGFLISIIILLSCIIFQKTTLAKKMANIFGEHK